MKTFNLAKNDARLLNNLLDVEEDFKTQSRQQKATKRIIKAQLSKGTVSEKYRPFLQTVLQFSVDRFNLVIAKVETGNVFARYYKAIRYRKFLKQIKSSKATCEKLKEKLK